MWKPSAAASHFPHSATTLVHGSAASLSRQKMQAGRYPTVNVKDFAAAQMNNRNLLYSGFYGKEQPRVRR